MEAQESHCQLKPFDAKAGQSCFSLLKRAKGPLLRQFCHIQGAYGRGMEQVSGMTQCFRFGQKVWGVGLLGIVTLGLLLPGVVPAAGAEPFPPVPSMPEPAEGILNSTGSIYEPLLGPLFHYLSHFAPNGSASQQQQAAMNTVNDMALALHDIIHSGFCLDFIPGAWEIPIGGRNPAGGGPVFSFPGIGKYNSWRWGPGIYIIISEAQGQCNLPI